MVTKAATKKPATVRTRLAVDLPGDTAKEIDVDHSDTVTVHVPKAFRLTLDAGHMIDVHAGTREMPREHAEHFYAVANGVTIKE